MSHENDSLTRLVPLLLAMGDDAWMIGHVGSEWLALAPDLEEDLAMNSIAQNDLGQALAYYTLVQELGGPDPDAAVYARAPADWRAAVLPARPRGDWAEWVVRRYLYETAGAVRRRALSQVSHPPLKSALERVENEVALQRAHANLLMEVLAGGGDESRRRTADALAASGPHWRELFQWGEMHEAWPYLAEDLDPARMEVEARAIVREDFGRWDLVLPRNLPDDPSPRRPARFPWFRAQIAALKEVRAMAPEAPW